MILLTSSVHSAPMPFHVDEYINSDKNVKIGEEIYRKLLDTPPLWVEPCGSVVDSEDVLDKDLTEAPQRYDELISSIDHIRVLSENAATQTKDFVRIFVSNKIYVSRKINISHRHPLREFYSCAIIIIHFGGLKKSLYISEVLILNLSMLG